VDEIKNYIESLTPEQIKATEELLLSVVARENDNVEGFSAFFEVITGRRLTKFAIDWIEQLYEAREQGKYFAIEAFRGSAKTTVLTSFLCFRIGHEPDKTYLTVQVGDDIAQDNSEKVADIIANNPGWKSCFPNVVPDMEKGWGAGGYEVKRDDIPYGQWRRLNSDRKDPTFIGLGYKSRAIIGKRVTGMLLIDDILDENNTASDKEMETVRKIMTGTLFPTIVKGAWMCCVFTPWKENDPVMGMTELDEFIRVKTPIVIECEDGFDLDGVKYKSIWPSRFPESEIRIRRAMSAKIEFARMYLLDLSKADSQVFRFYDFPAAQINGAWPVVGGVDYASSMKNVGGGAKLDTDYFALAYVCKLPMGGAVVMDGVLERTTMLPALGYVEKAQGTFPGWQHCVVEGDGKGEEFIQALMMKPGLKITPMKTGGKGKMERLERQMGPWLESMRVRISDADTPFLNELRKELREYPNNRHDDAMDAVYWALRGMPDVLAMPYNNDELPSFEKKKTLNPFLALGG
jgi:phage terminase large subunit-like protein